MLEKLQPRNQFFYRQVAQMVRRIESKESSIKREVYKKKDSKRYLPLVNKIILNYPLLSEIAEKSGLTEDIGLGVVVVYETLVGKINSTENKEKFTKILAGRPLKGITGTKYVRINTLRGSKEDLKEYLFTETCIPNVMCCTEGQNYGQEEKDSACKTLKDLYCDLELLSKVRFQNIASCLPSFILNPPEHSTVIDATAAPGNKTTHLCSIMNNTGTIHAFEKDKMRFNTMVGLLEKYGTTNVKAQHIDFLKVDPADYQADYILLDPSCSGSGIHLNYSKEQQRVDTLRNIQSVLLNHALKFNPMKLVYSTCSEHAEEGEDVVKEALEKKTNYEVESIGDFWKVRGHDGYDFSEKVIRSKKSEEEIGFFVTLLKRKEVV